MDETSASGLKDWAAIRVYLKKHDDEMINDHEDDINTMLVFVSRCLVYYYYQYSYLMWIRPVCSQLWLQHLLLSPTSGSNRTTHR